MTLRAPRLKEVRSWATQSSHPVPIITASWMTLRWTRGSRYYRAHLEQDLWAFWMVTQVNGRIGSPRGRARALAQPSLEAALLTLAAMVKRRQQRGYELSTPSISIGEMTCRL